MEFIDCVKNMQIIINKFITTDYDRIILLNIDKIMKNIKIPDKPIYTLTYNDNMENRKFAIDYGNIHELIIKIAIEPQNFDMECYLCFYGLNK